jgi:hypothetical protein
VDKEDFVGGSSLKVVTPIILSNIIGPAGHIPSALANFGHIKYGSQITARVYLSNENADGCQDFKTDTHLSNTVRSEHKGIIFVKQGNCPITTKVRNIQNLGAQLALI